MRIGIISTRLAGTDGVSLEVAKWVRVLQQLGHEIYFCAGELSGYASQGTLIPRMYFNDPSILALTQAAFGKGSPLSPEQIMDDVERLSREMKPALLSFIRDHQIELLILQNVLAIPMNLPLGHCLTEIISESGIAAIAHHHDFYWERERFQTNVVSDLLETAFPPDLPSIQHVTINSIAQNRLKRRRGIDSIVIPNVIDFNHPVPKKSDLKRDFRAALRLTASEPFVLQPTRVVQRKGIEMAIELLSAMDLAGPKLFITHSAADEGLDYWHWLQHESRMMGVSLQLVDRLVREDEGPDSFSLADVYLNADLVTYPSIYEGFGNALVEAVYYKCPVVVNRYPVYNCDIRPLGFQFIELDGYVSESAIQQANQVIHSRHISRDIVETNFEIAKANFSMVVLQQKLIQVLEKINVSS
jgi:glycosyltransferase involved in cell wall biosynthesis